MQLGWDAVTAGATIAAILIRMSYQLGRLIRTNQSTQEQIASRLDAHEVRLEEHTVRLDSHQGWLKEQAAKLKAWRPTGA